MKLFNRQLQRAFTGAIFILAVFPLLAQSQHPVTQRKYADVMGFGGAAWLERTEREQEEEPEKALDAIGISPGMVIGDVGCGTGYFARRMAKRTGPGGKVYAADIQPRMLESLKRLAAAEKLTNIETVLSRENDPLLPAGQLDLILMVDVYHEFAHPQTMLRHLRAALKPGGRMVLLEYRKEDPEVPIRLEHKMTVEEAKAEVEAEGFRLQKVISSLPRQHILIFVPGPKRVQ
ncbi:MAG: class I SAM-dependent methyltransferase [Bryobacteraceae bacterium]|nr:class I SAM-dependent methyltransferase [Bryobacteraceae bacterium]